jgi:hypothetical protein
MTWFGTKDAISEPNNLAFGFESNGTSIQSFKVMTAGSTRLFVGNTGSVGIGTSSPQSLLDVRGATPFIRITDTAVNSETGLIMDAGGGTIRGGLTINYGTGEFKSYCGVAGNGYFQTFNTNGSERMRITSVGSVLIGTTSDNGQKLQVNGQVNMYNYTSFQTSTKTASSGSNIGFDMNGDYGKNAGNDNVGGLVVININEASTNINLGNAAYVGVVINPRGSGGAINQIAKYLGGGVTALSVSMSGNSIVVNATISGGGNYRASLTFIGGGGTS